MAKGPAKTTPSIRNRKAWHEFEILERLEAGIALSGTEVKSLRSGKASLEEAYARIIDGEVYLVGCHISPYEQGGVHNHDPLRKRKLLLHRREIKRLLTKVQQRGQTLVPLAIYFNARGLAKVELALARGKTKADRREDLKQREARREIERALKRRR